LFVKDQKAANAGKLNITAIRVGTERDRHIRQGENLKSMALNIGDRPQLFIDV
jgi:hypothetical protein